MRRLDDAWLSFDHSGDVSGVLPGLEVRTGTQSFCGRVFDLKGSTFERSVGGWFRMRSSYADARTKFVASLERGVGLAIPP